MKIAVVGKSKIGKSRFIASLLNKRYVHATTVDFHEYRVGNNIIVDTPYATALPKADLFLVMVDGSKGIDHLDLEVISQVRKTGSKLQVVARYGIENLAELTNYLPIISSKDVQLYKQVIENTKTPEDFLKITEHAIDWNAKKFIDDTLFERDRIEDDLDDNEIHEETVGDELDEPVLDTTKIIQLIGKENAGKSTLFNAITGKNVAVSAVGGTTKEGVEVEAQGFIFKDTAGGRVLTDADLVIFVIDGTKPLSTLDKKMFSKIKGRACICAMNKSDHPDFKPVELPVPVIHTSGLHKKGIKQLLAKAREVIKIANTRLSTAQLNRWLTDYKTRFHGVRVKHAIHVSVKPYTVVMFVNNLTKLAHLRNLLEEYFGLQGIRTIVKMKSTAREKKIVSTTKPSDHKSNRRV